MNASNATVAVQQAAGTPVVTVRGEIDLGNVETVGRELEAAMTVEGIQIVDLTDVTYIDSQGARLLADLARTCASGLTLVAPTGSTARDLLAITGLDEHLVVVETVGNLDR